MNAALSRQAGGTKGQRMNECDSPAKVGSNAHLGAWLPAATAPQDGTHFLGYFPRHPFGDDENMDESVDLGGIMAVTFKSGSGWVEPDYMDATGAYFGDDYCYAPAPTFWMRLPPAPAIDSPGPPIDRLLAAKALASAQADDDGLWFNAETAPEAYLQQALRQLTAAIEAA